MLRIGFLTELVARGHVEKTLAATLAAIEQCEPGVVRSMKRQLNAIAAGRPRPRRGRAPPTKPRSARPTSQRRLAALSTRKRR